MTNRRSDRSCSYTQRDKGSVSAPFSLGFCREILRQLRAGLEAFFDRVNHDWPIVRVKCHVADRDLLRLVNLYLQAGGVGDLTEVMSLGMPLAARCHRHSSTWCWMNSIRN